MNELWATFVLDPEAAKGRIIAAYQQTNGNAVKAAEVLGVTHRTLMRWVKRMSLEADIEHVRVARAPGNTDGTDVQAT